MDGWKCANERLYNWWKMGFIFLYWGRDLANKQLSISTLYSWCLFTAQFLKWSCSHVKLHYLHLWYKKMNNCFKHVWFCPIHLYMEITTNIYLLLLLLLFKLRFSTLASKHWNPQNIKLEDCSSTISIYNDLQTQHKQIKQFFHS